MTSHSIQASAVSSLANSGSILACSLKVGTTIVSSIGSGRRLCSATTPDGTRRVAAVPRASSCDLSRSAAVPAASDMFLQGSRMMVAAHGQGRSPTRWRRSPWPPARCVGGHQVTGKSAPPPLPRPAGAQAWHLEHVVEQSEYLRDVDHDIFVDPVPAAALAETDAVAVVEVQLLGQGEPCRRDIARAENLDDRGSGTAEDKIGEAGAMR